jgi:hypothetical protein
MEGSRGGGGGGGGTLRPGEPSRMRDDWAKVVVLEGGQI